MEHITAVTMEHGPIVVDREQDDLAAEYDAILTRQGALLTGVANALNGPPPALTSWSHHDLPEKAQALVDQRARVRNLVSDWQANAGSRALGDRTADTWNEAALQLLRILEPEGAIPAGVVGS